MSGEHTGLPAEPAPEPGSDQRPAPLLVVLTTVGDRDAAQRIAQAVVERGLAACVQLEAIDSVYRWQGAVQQEPEVRLLVKVAAAGYDALAAAILELHPYELPALVALPVERAHAPFARWVAEGSRGAGPGEQGPRGPEGRDAQDTPA